MTSRKYRRTLASIGLTSLLPSAALGTTPIVYSEGEGAAPPPDDAMIDVFRTSHSYQLAGHSSHSSHRSHGSHRSHRSSSGGSSSPAPQRTSPSRNYNSTPANSILPSSPYVALRQQPVEFEEHVDLVRKLQASLWAQKFYSGQLDGIAGPETKAAIGKFQARRGVEVTGRITETLLGDLDIDIASIFDEKVYLKTLPGNSGKFKRIVQEVQVILFIYGYYTGVVDGVIGPGSRAAISEFQKGYGLKQTGTLTTDTLDALHISAN